MTTKIKTINRTISDARYKLPDTQATGYKIQDTTWLSQKSKAFGV